MGSTHPEYLPAVQEWAALLGAPHVTTDAAALSAASSATFQTAARVLAILRPGTRDEVQACVRIANRHAVPLYPISTGQNWGYGSRVPVRDSVVVDLGRLNRILALDEDLALRHPRTRGHPAAASRLPARAGLAVVDGCDRCQSGLQHHRQHARARFRSHADGRSRRQCLRLRGRAPDRRVSRNRIRPLSGGARRRARALGRRAGAGWSLHPGQSRHRHPDDGLVDAAARRVSRRSFSCVRRTTGWRRSSRHCGRYA